MDWEESHELCVVDTVCFSLVKKKKKESETMGKMLHATHSADNQIWVVRHRHGDSSCMLTHFYLHVIWATLPLKLL